MRGARPGSGHRHPALGKIQAPGGLKGPDGPHQGGKIGQRLPHAHEHQVGEGLVNRDVGARHEDLADHFPGAEVAAQPLAGGEAKAAAQGAPHLAGKAQGAVVFLRDKHRFDAEAVRQKPAELLGPVLRGLPGRQGQDAQPGPGGQLLPKSPAEIGHFPEILHPFVHPLEDLPGPEAGMTPSRNQLFQFRQVKLLKVNG
jgi:hypothetical protein